MAAFNYERTMNEIQEITLFENAIEMYSIYEYKFKKGQFAIKWLYEKNRDEFIRKFKLCYLTATDSKIKNFIQIYLQPVLDDNFHDLGDFSLNDEIRINRLCFVGNYLKDKNVYINHGWLIENGRTGFNCP